MSDMLKRLFAHMEWADAQVQASFRTTPPPAKALDLYAHILGAEHVWLTRLRRAKAEYAVWPALSLKDCEELASRNASEYASYVASADAAALATDIAYVNSAGQSFTSRVDDILVHVAMHGAYHRGQVALLVREAGSKPAPTDYIAFVRGAPAATRKP